MRTMRIFNLAMVLAPSIVSAQGLFWLVDFNNQFIGEIASIDPEHAWVAIPAPDGEPVFTPVTADGGDPYTPALLLYESANCSGPAYIDAGFNASTKAHRVGFFLTDNLLYASKRLPSVVLEAQSKRGSDLNCVGTTSTGYVAREVEEIGTVSFTAPFKVIRNPNALLLDGVELGNTSHWSSGIPAAAAPEPATARHAARAESGSAAGGSPR